MCRSLILPAYHLHELVVGYGVKVLLKVGVEYVPMSTVKCLTYGCYCLMSISFGAKSKTTIFEIRLKDRLDDEFHRHPRHSIPDRRYSRPPSLSIGLRDVDPTHRLCSVGLLLEFLLQR